MPSSWPSAYLRDHVELLVGFPFKSDEFSHEPPGARLVRGDNITEGRLRWEDTRYWRESSSSLERYALKAGDVVIGMDGSRVGRNWARIRHTDLPLLLVQRVACLRARPSLDQGFLAALISSDSFRRHVHAYRTGSSIPHISGGQIGQFSFKLPPLSEQRVIAAVLDSLADKIDCNRRESESLAMLARAIFGAWFSDEGVPVLKLPKAQRGWKQGTLADITTVNPEVWTAESRPQTLRYVDLSSTKWGRIESITVVGKDDAPSRAQRVLRPGDTIVGTVRPANGSYALVAEEGLTGSTGFAVLRPKQKSLSELVYLAATSPENIRRLGHVADGGAYPAVRPDAVAQTIAPIPDEEAANHFASAIGPFFKKIALNNRQSGVLAELRESALSGLLTGDIAVRQVDDIVGKLA